MGVSGSPLGKTSPSTVVIADAAVTGALTTILLPVILGVVAAAPRVLFKTSLQMPGHSSIWWLAPILAAKLLAGRHYSATLASFAAGSFLVMFSYGTSRFLGPAAFMAAGVFIDGLGAVVRLLSRTGFGLFVCTVGLGVGANLCRFAVRLLHPGPKWRFDLVGMSGRIGSYAFFGALTGAIVAAAFLACRNGRRARK